MTKKIIIIGAGITGCATACELINRNFDIDFSEPVFLVAFLILTFIVSYLSYIYIELPVREYFRKSIK